MVDGDGPDRQIGRGPPAGALSSSEERGGAWWGVGGGRTEDRRSRSVRHSKIVSLKKVSMG